jgi:hypothetical protein
LLFQEDPGSQNQYPVGTGTTARVWGYDLKAGGAPFVVAKVDQSADEGPTDKDVSTMKGAAGSWESSGIVDASKYLGKGTFLIDVQAHTLAIQEEAHPPVTFVREGGQLLALRMGTSGHGGDRHHGKKGDDRKDHGKKGGKR